MAPALVVLLAWLAFAGLAGAAEEPALLDAVAPPPAAAAAPDAAVTEPLAVDAPAAAAPAVSAVGAGDPAPVQEPVAAVAVPPPPPATVPPAPAPADPVAPPSMPMPDPAADFEDALGAMLTGLVGDTLLGGLPETVLPDLRDELGPHAGLIGQVRDSVKSVFDPFPPSPTPAPPASAPPGAGGGTPPPVVGPAPPIVAPVLNRALALVQPVTTTRAAQALLGDPGPAPAALAVADPARVADPLGAGAGEGGTLGPPGSPARTRALGADGTESGVAPLAAAPAAASATAAPISAAALQGPPGPRAPIPPAPVSERTAPAGAAPAGPAPILPPAPAPAPTDPTGLSGLGGSTTSTLLLGVAALCGLIALARPPNGMRRLSLQPAPYVPAIFAVSLERPG